MIERLLPASVSVCTARGDDPEACLTPEEAALIASAVAPRRAEFATARGCARHALSRLGAPPVALLRGPKHEPLWPEGFVGSITHCTGYRAAAVARATEVLTVGIDAEPHAPCPPGVASRILVTEERDWIATVPHGIHWDRLIFCAKESVYKAWYPLAKRWLGFADASVIVDPEAGTFLARLIIEPPEGVPRRFEGHYLIEDGLIVTAIAVPL